MKHLIFNNNYVLKPDNGCTLMMARYVGRNLLVGKEDSFNSVIHPIFAMILSFMNGRDYQSCICDAAAYLHVNTELIENFVLKLLNNPKEVLITENMNEGGSLFPPYTIISIDKETIEKRYTPDDFKYDHINLQLGRHLTPSTITLMVNNICVTDCIYCYEDKSMRRQCSIPLSRIISLIHEAHDVRVNTFDVIGGEFFLYSHWKDVLQELRKYDFNPFLSTKMPLTESDVYFLSSIKIKDIQLSIDSMIEKHLMDSIKVREGYVKKMHNCLLLLNKYHIPVLIHSVLTKYNGTVDDMRSIYEIIKNYDNIQEWHIVKGDPTLYPRINYDEIEISSSSMDIVTSYLRNVSETAKMKVVYPNSSKPLEFNEEVTKSAPKSSSAKAMFFNRAFCSGLFSSLYILPDGKVTICEQLYL